MSPQIIGILFAILVHQHQHPHHSTPTITNESSFPVPYQRHHYHHQNHSPPTRPRQIASHHINIFVIMNITLPRPHYRPPHPSSSESPSFLNNITTPRRFTSHHIAPHHHHHHYQPDHKRCHHGYHETSGFDRSRY